MPGQDIGGTPGASNLPYPLEAILAGIDSAGDAWSDRLRGRPWADVGAAVLSNLADHGVVWVLAAGVKARRPGPGRRRAIWTLAGAGVASFSVNRAVKQAVGRSRPAAVETRVRQATVDTEARPGFQPSVRAVFGTGALPASLPLPVRRPSSSSFPSGHTLAAFCAAIALGDGPAETLGALGFASGVAASRVHLRAHHLSDVLAGALIGAATGIGVRAVVACCFEHAARRSESVFR